MNICCYYLFNLLHKSNDFCCKIAKVLKCEVNTIFFRKPNVQWKLHINEKQLKNQIRCIALVTNELYRQGIKGIEMLEM